MKERVIIQEFDMSCLQDVRDGMFLYEYNSKNEKIDIKKSAELWWDDINIKLNQLGYWLFDEG